MFARATTFSGASNPQVVEIIREVLPHLRSLPGFMGMTAVRSVDGLVVQVMSFWETLEDLETSMRRAELAAEGVAITGFEEPADITLERFEVLHVEPPPAVRAPEG